MKSLVDLRNHLGSVQPGPVPDGSLVEELLCECWDDFAGSADTSMAAQKLDRIEDLRWDPPELSFIIERHGAKVAGGSSRAEKQSWVVDLDTLTATPNISGFRQMEPMQPRLDIAPLVERVVCGLERADRNEACVTRVSETTVRVRIGDLIPATGPQQTMANRRRRFRTALEARLADIGWHPVQGAAPYTYESQPRESDPV